MRPKNEIDNALSQLLRLHGHEIDIIRDVLTNRLSSECVFRIYMKEKSEAERNIEDYYKARDAAMYLKGEIELDALIDGAEPYESPECINCDNIDKGAFNVLLRRIENLEHEVKKLRKQITRKTVVNPHIENKEDLVSKNEAVEYIGCSIDALTRWTAQGYVPAYRISKRYYYKKSELDKSDAIRNYLKQS